MVMEERNSRDGEYEGGAGSLQAVVVQEQEARDGGGGGANNELGGNDGVVGCEGGGEGGKSDMVSVEISMKKNRGRPRKYNVDGNTVSLVWPSLASPRFSSSLSETYAKRSRGRPRGSRKLQLLASLGGFAAETAGGSFTPHVVSVQTGEDAVSKILSIALKGPRAACVLSATGVLSSVIIRQPGSAGGILRYDGRFEILSLSGSYIFGEIGTAHRKNGMLSVSLAKPDGQVFGGGVAGSLIAAGPIQIIVASFKQNISKELRRRQSTEPCTANVLDNSETVRVPMRNAGITGGEKNCATPASAVVEPTNGEAAGNTVTPNENVNPDSQNCRGNQHVLQSSQPISEQRIVSPYIHECLL